MLDKVKSSDTLLPVRVVQRLDGGTDVWLRKNIEGPLTEPDSGEGFNSTFYEADEVFIRLTETVSTEDVETAFDAYWEQAAAYDPHTPPMTDKARIAALEEELKAAKILLGLEV